MRVKKFEAKSMKDALQMVKNELGPDAVILSARDNRKAFGIGGEASVEITAAVSETTLQKKRFVESRLGAGARERLQAADARTQKQFINRMVDSRMREQEAKSVRRPITSVSYIDIPDDEVTPRRVAAMKKAAGRNVVDLLDDFDADFEEWKHQPVRASVKAPVQATSKAGVAPRSTRVQAITSGEPTGDPDEVVSHSPSSATALERIRGAAREAWQAGLSTVQEKAKYPTAPATSRTSGGGLEMIAESTSSSAFGQEAEISSLKNEIDRLQKVLEGFQKVPQSFVTRHPGADYGVPYDLSFMFQRLVESGVTIDHTADILTQAAKEMDPVQMKKRAVVDAWVARWFLSHIQTAENPWAGRLHLFVGASGSGKTSSLVKMASHLVVKAKKKVAILSTDSFKVGAVDQMKIYCQILNIPFAVIRNRRDWDWVLNQLSSLDHILVDFPGMQLSDLNEIELLRSLLPPAESRPVCHLCVSATSKDGDAFEIARRYKVANYNDLIFANLDQSVQHGIIFNLHAKTSKPLHSFGIGSRIPEDFELATKERVLDLIFKLSKLRRESK